VRLFRLLLLGAAAAYVYRRFVANSDAGLAETQDAEPYSSEQLTEEPAAPESSSSSQATVVRQAPSQDTIEHPTWLDPADAESDEGSAPAAGDGS
jgi:hypothetical protein